VAVAPAAFPAPVPGASALVASDGETYLMITNDDRGRRAMRLDADGRVTDPNGIPLRDASIVDVAGNGAEWLMVGRGALLLRRDGTVQRAAMDLDAPRVISNGRTFFAWSTNYSEHARGAVVFADGTLHYVDEHALPNTIGAAASNGDVYCVATAAGSAIFVNILDDAGRPLFAEPRKLVDAPIGSGRELRHIALARVHGNFRVFWLESEPTIGAHDEEIDWTLSSADFDAAGAIVSAPQVIDAGASRGSSWDFYGSLLNVAQAGPADAVVRWSMGWYLPRRQTTLGCGAVFSGVAGTLVSNGRSMLMLSYENVTQASTAMVLRRATFACDPTSLLTAQRELPVWAAPEQASVSITTGRADAIVAYLEQGRRRAHRISLDGRTLASIALPDEVNDAPWFRIATDGRTYFAFWIPNDASAVRYAKLVDSNSFTRIVKTIAPLHDRSNGFDAQWTGSEFLVVWTGKGRTFGGDEPILGARITRGAAMLDPGVIEIVPPDPEFQRRDLALSRGDGDLLLAWNDQGAGTGLPCGGCTAYAGARALRIDPRGTPLGSITELSSWRSNMETIVYNDGAWYVFISDPSGSNRVSRIDDAASVVELDLGFGSFDGQTRPSPHVAAFPMGKLGVGVYDGRSFDLLEDSAGALHISSDAAPALADAGWPHEVMFAPAGNGRLLAIFTLAVEGSPYAGAHRAFVSFVDLPAPAPKRRTVR
jgi:hypothetical protein